MSRSLAAGTILTAAILAWQPPTAQAVVDTLDATVTAEVLEYVGDSPGDSDSAFEDLTETTGNLPLQAGAELFTITDDPREAGGSAMTIFYDPRASQDPDPDEFSIDAGVFSLAADVSYLARSDSTETRQVTFLPGEVGAAEGTSLEARSQFFLDGILVVWGDQGVSDLTGTWAEVTLSVRQTRPGDPEPRVVLSASLVLLGQADGTVTVSAGGDLALENVTVLNLADPADDDFGPMHLVIIPATTALPYVYPAQAGETFTLKAEIEGKARCRPGTGAAVELGVPLLELATLVNEVSGGQTGDLFQQVIESAVGGAPPAAKPLLPAAQGTTVTVNPDGLSASTLLPFCGLMGIESAVLLMALSMAVGLCSRRRR